VSRESLAETKDGVVLVNAARPDLMDVSALAEGIGSGKIGAHAMDVFEGEQGICHFNRLGDEP
jgi:lactate dehydrogenase-like 2-hydroxyacid dehydrogenase